MSPVILLVDDDPSVRTSVARLLRRYSYEVIEAASADAVLVVAVEKRPDVILMDLHMPERSGVEAARALRQNPLLAGMPIIALTATPPRDRETRSLFDSILEKPCASADLLRALNAALRP